MSLLLYMLPLFVETSNLTSCEIKWYISELPVIFGGDVKLICRISNIMNCSRNTHRKIWTGGPRQRILTIDGTSVNDSKYTTQDEHDGFSLKIKKFTQEDANLKYSCSYGFDKHANVLAINDSFESIPTYQTLQQYHHLRNNLLSVCVLMNQIHPIPNCSFWFEHHKLSSNFSTNVTSNKSFYNMELNTSYEVENILCGQLQVICTFGTSTYSLIDEFIFDDQANQKENCSQISVSIGTLQLVVIFGLLIIFFTTIFSIISWKYRHTLENLCNCSLRMESQNAPESTIEESFL